MEEKNEFSSKEKVSLPREKGKEMLGQKNRDQQAGSPRGVRGEVWWWRKVGKGLEKEIVTRE